jgi:hypothetical protein
MPYFALLFALLIAAAPLAGSHAFYVPDKTPDALVLAFDDEPGGGDYDDDSADLDDPDEDRNDEDARAPEDDDEDEWDIDDVDRSLRT